MSLWFYLTFCLPSWCETSTHNRRWAERVFVCWERVTQTDRQTDSLQSVLLCQGLGTTIEEGRRRMSLHTDMSTHTHNKTCHGHEVNIRGRGALITYEHVVLKSIFPNLICTWDNKLGNGSIFSMTQSFFSRFRLCASLSPTSLIRWRLDARSAHQKLDMRVVKKMIPHSFTWLAVAVRGKEGRKEKVAK